MNVLAIADKKPDESIRRMVHENGIDIICTLGDLDLFGIKELHEIDEIPKIGVYGNHCSGTYFESLGIENLHLSTRKYRGFIFGGFEGSLRYKPSSVAKMYTHMESSRLLKDFPYVDVMLAHSPPYGINDEPGNMSHEGLRGLRQYVDQKGPKYFLHGHTYPDAEEMVVNHSKTQIRYVYQTRIIEIS